MNGIDFDLDFADVTEVVWKMDTTCVWTDGSSAPIKWQSGTGVLDRERVRIERRGLVLNIIIEARP